MDPYVFISYSREDQAYVGRLVEWLEETGIKTWADQDIDYGDTWPQQIEKSLDEAEAVVVVMSPAARESIWVSREIARAERKEKPTFPILLSGDPLLQFETTQYEVVLDGSLPSPRFADRIAEALGVTLHSLGADLLDLVRKYRESGVLILGRFTAERQQVLVALQQALRQRGYIPVLFDFDLPQGLNLHETVLLFALAVRFIVADLSDPSSIPQELLSVVPNARVPVRPIIKAGERPFAMFEDFGKFPRPLCTRPRQSWWRISTP